MADEQCVQPGQKSFGNMELLANYGRRQTESLYDHAKSALPGTPLPSILAGALVYH